MGHLGLIPGLGRSPGEGEGYPFQYSGLENSVDCTVHGVAKSRTPLSDFHSLTPLPSWPLPALPLASQGLSPHWYSQLFPSSSCPFLFGLPSLLASLTSAKPWKARRAFWGKAAADAKMLDLLQEPMRPICGQGKGETLRHSEP